MSADGHRTKWWRKSYENFNRLSRAHERYRQTTDRQTDVRRHIANMNLSSRSLKMHFTDECITVKQWRPSSWWSDGRSNENFHYCQGCSHAGFIESGMPFRSWQDDLWEICWIFGGLERGGWSPGVRGTGHMSQIKPIYRSINGWFCIYLFARQVDVARISAVGVRS